MIIIYAKHQINVFKHKEQKCGKVIIPADGLTDKQSDSENLLFPSTSSVKET